MIRSHWFRRLALSVAAIAGVTAFAGLPEPQGFGATPTHNADPATEARTAALHDRGVVIDRRMAYKEQLVVGLLEHRYSLDEVAREFLRVIAEDETNLMILRLNFAGPTDEARAARNVIAYARSQPLPPYEMSLAVAHLQAEFRRLYPSR